jgi:hypothetical protein
VWGCRVDDGRYMAGRVKGGMGPGSGVLHSGMRRVQQTMRFQRQRTRLGQRAHTATARREDKKQVKRAKGRRARRGSQKAVSEDVS